MASYIKPQLEVTEIELEQGTLMTSNPNDFELCGYEEENVQM